MDAVVRRSHRLAPVLLFCNQVLLRRTTRPQSSSVRGAQQGVVEANVRVHHAAPEGLRGLPVECEPRRGQGLRVRRIRAWRPLGEGRESPGRFPGLGRSRGLRPTLGAPSVALVCGPAPRSRRSRRPRASLALGGVGCDTPVQCGGRLVGLKRCPAPRAASSALRSFRLLLRLPRTDSRAFTEEQGIIPAPPVRCGPADRGGRATPVAGCRQRRL